MGYATRDSQGCAIKSTYVELCEEQFVGESLAISEIKTISREIFKDPITDSGVKKSARGLLAVYKDSFNGNYVLADRVTWKEVNNCELQTVFLNGKLVKETNLSEIRERLAKHI